MREHYYGFNFKSIPKEVVKYKQPLENGDVIENQNGKCLYWSEHDNAFKLLTENAYDYLEKEELFTKWKKI